MYQACCFQNHSFQALLVTWLQYQDFAPDMYLSLSMETFCFALHFLPCCRWLSHLDWLNTQHIIQLYLLVLLWSQSFACTAVLLWSHRVSWKDCALYIQHWDEGEEGSCISVTILALCFDLFLHATNALKQNELWLVFPRNGICFCVLFLLSFTLC